MGFYGRLGIEPTHELKFAIAAVVVDRVSIQLPSFAFCEYALTFNL